jgi:hypothetical protein
VLFDRLCGFVERNMPSLEPSLRHAKLFWWPGKAQDLPKQWEPEEIEFLRENFFLPFPIVAVEDSISCVLLEDVEKDQRGLGTPRRFIECLNISEALVTDSAEAQERPEDTGKWLDVVQHIQEKGDVTFITLGRGHFEKTTAVSRLVRGSIIACCMVTKEGVATIQPGSWMWTFAERCALRNFSTAIEEVITFNTPNRFVVEVSPAVKKRTPHSPKIPRSHDRPKYTLLTKTEVQRVLEVESNDENDRRHPSAHWRRRHYRTFRSEKFVGMKGKTIVVPACWVGPTEKQVGTKIYKVRIDL